MDKTTINGAPISDLQEKFKRDDLIALMKVTRLVELAPVLDDKQYTVFLNALMHYSIKVVGWAENRAPQATATQPAQTRALTDEQQEAIRRAIDDAIGHGRMRDAQLLTGVFFATQPENGANHD